MNTGYIIGRFNHITLGHKKLIDIGLKLTDKLLLIVGSANLQGTMRNPFSVDLRIELITKVYQKEIDEGKIIVRPLDDMSSENDVPEDGSWGRYLLNNATRFLGTRPNISIYAYEESRNKWYSPEDLDGIDEIMCARHENSISATKIRSYLLKNDKVNWEKNTPCEIHNYYDRLRKIIVEINGGI